MVSFRVRLPAEQAAVVLKAIEAAKASLDGEDLEDVPAEMRIERIDNPPAYPDEDVSAETRRARSADALVRLAEAYLEPDGKPRALAEKYQVHVHLDLRKDAAGPVEDPDAPALAETTLRRLGCEAGLVPVLHEGGYHLQTADDGALIFTRPSHERIPEVPRPFALTGCLPGVSAETPRCQWDGGRPDYSSMIEILDYRALEMVRRRT
jgi:hypothetical protein